MSTAPLSSITLNPPGPVGSRSTPTRLRPEASAASSASCTATGGAEPETAGQPGECGLQLRAVVTELHVGSPAAEARLQHGREVEVGNPGVALYELGARVRQPGSAEDAGGQQLVVRADDRVRVVQDGDTGLGEALERPE